MVKFILVHEFRFKFKKMNIKHDSLRFIQLRRLIDPVMFHAAKKQQQPLDEKWLMLQIFHCFNQFKK